MAGQVLLLALALDAASAAPRVEPPLPERTPANVEVAAGRSADPVTLEIAYAADVFSSAAGGRRRGTRYIDNLALIAGADLEALAGVPRTTASVQLFHNNGAAFSGTVVGDAQTISGIETGNALIRLYEAWVEHRGANDRWSVKLGLYDINSEFDALNASLLFVHSAHGMGTDLAQSGSNGPSTFPDTSVGLRGAYRAGNRLTLRAAVMDGVPNDPRHPRRTRFRFGRGEGAFLIAEADATLGDVRLLAGGWSYTARGYDLFDKGRDAAFIRRSRSRGAYLRGEAQLTGDDTRAARGFARLGVASGRTEQFDAFASAGISWRRPLKGRLRDEAGIALAYAAAGSATRRLSRLRAGTAEPGELAIEFTYRIQITDMFSLQPDIQYVVNPGVDPALGDALALGMRISFNLPL